MRYLNSLLLVLNWRLFRALKLCPQMLYFINIAPSRPELLNLHTRAEVFLRLGILRMPGSAKWEQLSF